ncbi:hypothetical protein BLFGPEAP_00963 [Candidatus Methanoperedenaceae archaeon GB50]|nr:hypothetical protein BLFGPEAP_00963 [Candidatus Methanoperedenaceae archaeon GB50]
MLSAMAQCRMQIEKCKIAFCQIGTLARWNWELGIGNWELGTGNWEFLFSVSYFLFPVSLFFFMHVYKVVS